MKGQLFDGRTARPQEIEITLEDRLMSFELDGSAYRLRPSMIHSVEHERDYLRLGLAKNQALILQGKGIADQLEAVGFGRRELAHTRGGRHLAVWVTALTLVALLLLASWKPAMDWVADRVALAIPHSAIAGLGDTAYNSVVDNMGIVQGRRVRQSLAGISSTLNELYPDLPKPIRIEIMDRFDTFNAFALPNGVILISRDAIRFSKDRETLIALIGHETGHLVHRHSARRLVRMILLPLLAGLFFGDASSLSSLMAENAGLLFNLAHGRHEEMEADLEGLKLLTQLQMDPQGALKLTQALKKVTGDMPGWLEYLATHPASERRMEEMREAVKKTKKRTRYDAGPLSDDDWKILRAVAGD